MSESSQSNASLSSAIGRTLISVSKDYAKPLQEFGVGDLVLVAESTALKSWTQKPVKFAMGTDARQKVLAKISFGNQKQEIRYLIVTTDQPFLMRDGKLKKLSRLIPHSDELVRADGTTVPIQSITLDWFSEDIKDIATSAGSTQSLDGHLILANVLL